MITIFTLIFFIFGLIIGSFLNVVIYRFNTARSLGGRSACMSCSHALPWYELIPLLSFLGLKGRCSSCQGKISIQYPLVELTSGIMFLFLFLRFQDIFWANTNVLVFSLTYAYYVLMFSILLVIAVYDLKHKIIPDVLALIFGILAFVGLFFFNDSVLMLHIPTLFQFSSGFVIAFPLAFMWLLSRGTWMGLGDAKLAIGLGWLLGLSGAFSGLLLSFWSGAIIGIILIIFSKKHGIKSEIPFAPFLVLGAFLAFIFELHIF